MMNRRALLLALAACGDDGATATDDAGSDTGSGGAHLDPAPGVYRNACDGSGGLALDAMHFLDVTDNDQIARVYRRGLDGAPVHTIDLNAGLGLTANVEGDLEEVTRIGNRLYVVTSHGRRASGNLDRARYHFAAFDIGGTPPAITLTAVGQSASLLDQMVVSTNWDEPNTAIIAALDAASDLGSQNEPTLAPEAMGTNLEAMTHDNAGRLLFGFRNPRAGGAIVVALANPDAVIAGQPARFAWGRTVQVGASNGLRSMAWSDALSTIWLVDGPVANAGGFSLWTWDTTNAPVLRQALMPGTGSPEGLVTYPETADVQLLLDMSSATVGNVQCADATETSRLFRDQIVRID